ncbi:MAG: TlpA family protein disulfide reductase [Myxococcota bacterium]
MVRAVCGALFLLVVSGFVAPRAIAAAGDGLSVGTKAPSFQLPVVNDFDAARKRFGPGDWMGPEAPKKLVLLSFFATYCEPCRKEMPELARLYKTYAEEGLGVVLVSIDKGLEERDKVVALAAEHGVTFPVLHDRFQVVARRYDAERLPYMLFLDAEGLIQAVHVGYSDDIAAGLEAEVRHGLGLAPLLPTDKKATVRRPAHGPATGKVTKTRSLRAKPAPAAEVQP